MQIPSSLPQQPRYLVAHRGWPARAPENSDVGFALACAARAPVVELDVRPTADGRLVVIHDETPERITGDRRTVWEQTLEQLRSRPLLADPRLKLTTLDEALAQLAHRTTVDIELKAGGAQPRELSEMLFSALSRCGSPPQIVVTSDTPELIAEIKVHGSMISSGLVFRWRDDTAALDVVEEIGAELIVANHRRIDAEFIARAERSSLTLWASTLR